MRRHLIICLLFAAPAVALAQLRVGLAYYYDTTKVDRARLKFDATDGLGTWTDFLRLDAEYEFSDRSGLSIWVDLDSDFVPVNFKLGYRYHVAKALYFEGLVRRMVLFTPWYDQYADIYDQRHAVYQAGIGSGFRKQISIVELALASQLLAGTSERSVQRDLLFSDTNFRSLRTEEFRTRKFRSLRMEASISLQVFRIEKISTFLHYKFVCRQDWFDFENTTNYYEWTREQMTSDHYTYAHTFLHIQHHFGVLIVLKDIKQ